MQKQIADLADQGVLVCPDDASRLGHFKGRLHCTGCDREFPILADRVVDLIPIETPADGFNNDLYTQSYRDSRGEVFVPGETTAPWADPLKVGPDALNAKARHVSWISQRLLADGGNSDLILCDMSAGPGYYSLQYATSFRCVLHCDLSARALSYAHGQAAARGLNNVVFLRIDYLRPPFANSLDRIICFDTLIRGQMHDLSLLRAIGRSLRADGKAIVDFHNWWHNPARRLGLLPDNFVGNVSYTRPQVRSLLKAARALGRMEAYYQEFDSRTWYAPLLSRILPPARHTASLSGAWQ